MTIIESVRQFIATYQGLDGDRLKIDFLPAKAASYSVDVVPAKTVVKQYLDGSSLRQFLFVLASRTHYGPEIRQQIDNIGFFEDFSGWLETQNRKRIYPDLGEGRVVRKMEVSTSGYAFAPGTETARYQIQCKIIYFERGGQ